MTRSFWIATAFSCPPPPWGRVWVVCLWGLFLLPGCGSEDAIRQYTVPKESQLAGLESEQAKMLGAIVPKDTPWAFKLMGKPEQVEQYQNDFRQLVNSFSFADDGTPKWQLPDAWKEVENSNPFVFRSFRPSQDNKLTVTLTQLKFDSEQLNEATWRDYVVKNVNRWREQLQLRQQDWEQMASELEPIEKLSMPQAPAYFVSLRGVSGAGGPMSGMPMPGAGAPGARPAGSVGSGPSPSGRAKEDLKVTLPEGWREVAPLSIMALRSYEVTDEQGRRATVTFTAAGGDRTSNVARWNQQIGGDPQQVPQALESAQKLTIHNAPTEVYRLVGPGDDPQAITAAKIDWSSQDALFVKMMGPAELVQSQHDAFLAMLADLKW